MRWRADGVPSIVAGSPSAASYRPKKRRSAGGVIDAVRLQQIERQALPSVADAVVVADARVKARSLQSPGNLDGQERVTKVEQRIDVKQWRGIAAAKPLYRKGTPTLRP